jgi:hypothetical protein
MVIQPNAVTTGAWVVVAVTGPKRTPTKACYSSYATQEEAEAMARKANDWATRRGEPVRYEIEKHFAPGTDWLPKALRPIARKSTGRKKR